MFKYFRVNSLYAIWGLGILSMGVWVGLTSCGPTPPRKTAATMPATRPAAEATPEVRWTLAGVRGETAYVKMDLPVIVTGTRIEKMRIS